MLRGLHRFVGLTGVVAVFAAALPCAAIAAKAPGKRAAKPRVTVEAADRLRGTTLTPFAPQMLDSARFTFTAPGRPAANARLDTVERAFRFTPSGQTGRKALSIGVTSRVVTAAADTSRLAPDAGAPTAYNVGLSVGWRGFAVAGGFTRVDTGLAGVGPNRREGVDLSFGYRARNWKTAVQLAAETGSPLLLTPLERRYSIDVGGAYALGPRLSLSGGVRYRLAPVAPGLLDTDRDDQSVYLGTAFSF